MYLSQRWTARTHKLGIGLRACGAGLLALLLAGCSPNSGRTAAPANADRAQSTTSEKTAKDANMKTEKAMFGAGCFWGVEETFRQLPGVVSTAVGYAGGKMVNPTYKDVCTDKTGHAEVVLIEYDPQKVSYDQLLDIFWKSHDPTLLNRQGPDVGTQYRTAIFTFPPEQEKLARESKARQTASGRYKRPIVTTIEPAPAFYKAEDYHQQYL